MGKNRMSCFFLVKEYIIAMRIGAYYIIGHRLMIRCFNKVT